LWCRYSFAIVGINITDLAYSLLVSGALKTHLYNVAPEMPSLVNFQQTFCEWYHNVAIVLIVKTTLEVKLNIHFKLYTSFMAIQL